MSNDNSSQFAIWVNQHLEQYRVVDRLIQQVHDRTPPSASTEELEHINQLLNEIKSTEANLKPLRNAMEAAGESPTPELKKSIDETIQLVMGLIPKIGELEKLAVESRDKLAPQIRASAKAVQMKNAYGRSTSVGGTT